MRASSKPITSGFLVQRKWKQNTHTIPAMAAGKSESEKRESSLSQCPTRANGTAATRCVAAYAG